MQQKYIIKSPKEMDIFAAMFSKTLKGGDVLALTGELGAGKTAFAKGLAKAFGIKQMVQSPTFLLMKCYPVKIVHRPLSIVHTLCHVDAYRIKNERELITVGMVEHLNDPKTVTLIEWADLVKGIVPDHAIRLEFRYGKTETERTVTVTRN